jgi:hypothetical protein
MPMLQHRDRLRNDLPPRVFLNEKIQVGRVMTKKAENIIVNHPCQTACKTGCVNPRVKKRGRQKLRKAIFIINCGSNFG